MATSERQPRKRKAYQDFEMKFVQCEVESEKEVVVFWEIDIMDGDKNGVQEEEEGFATLMNNKGDEVKMERKESEPSRKGARRSVLPLP
jgi:hypothetical protein